MNIWDHNDVAASEVLMTGLRNAMILKYLVFVTKNATYQELIVEILSPYWSWKEFQPWGEQAQPCILLKGKHKLDTQINTC